MRLTIPATPISVNTYKLRTRAGITFKSKEARAFEDAVSLAFRQQKPEPLPRGDKIRYAVCVSLYLGEGRHPDLDNTLKQTLDSLQDVYSGTGKRRILVERRLIDRDSHIDHICAHRYRDNARPRTEIEIVVKRIDPYHVTDHQDAEPF